MSVKQRQGAQLRGWQCYYLIAHSDIHLYKSSRTGENDKEEVRDGEVEQEGVGELAQGGGAHDRRDHQEGTDGGHLGHICWLPYSADLFSKQVSLVGQNNACLFWSLFSSNVFLKKY